MTSTQGHETETAEEEVVEGLWVRAEGPVLTVTLDRPDGLMTLAMCDALADILTRPSAAVHVVVLAASGGTFCLGRERTATSAEDLPLEVERLIALNRALVHTPTVTVARVHGDAAGFGVGLAALADVAVATETARFSFPEVTMNLAPTLVLAWLERVVGRRAAFWMTATGQPVAGAEAVSLGLVNEVVADRDTLDAAVARRVAALREHSPRVHTEIRSMLRSATELSLEQASDVAADRLVLGSMRRRTS